MGSTIVVSKKKNYWYGFYIMIKLDEIFGRCPLLENIKVAINFIIKDLQNDIIINMIDITYSH